GPVAASGYEWYEVAPIDVRLTGLAGEPATVVTESLGWVAAASRSGDAWLTPGSATCPPLPSDFRTLFGSTEGMRLACLGGIPVTVPARLVESNCDSDPALEYDPAWFGSWQGAPMLVDRTDSAAGPQCLHLLLAPGARHPNPLPVDRVVSVTGLFDHPDARECRIRWEGAPFERTDSCRSMFVVTSLRRDPATG
ncbi:MAG TPA: hypothetical protein VFS32_12225, partial [Candidatus Limnocylindrales bacterium]|nr:hypothetical protein [Candidatus Limnocylindrales bacterium]